MACKKRGGMMESYISGKIEKGDLIIAILNKWCSVGIYLGKGKGRSHQYYRISTLAMWFNSKRDYHVPKSYISNADEYRFIKYSPELLSEGRLKDYNTALEAIKILNI